MCSRPLSCLPPLGLAAREKLFSVPHLRVDGDPLRAERTLGGGPPLDVQVEQRQQVWNGEPLLCHTSSVYECADGNDFAASGTGGFHGSERRGARRENVFDHDDLAARDLHCETRPDHEFVAVLLGVDREHGTLGCCERIRAPLRERDRTARRRDDGAHAELGVMERVHEVFAELLHELGITGDQVLGDVGRAMVCSFQHDMASRDERSHAIQLAQDVTSA